MSSAFDPVAASLYGRFVQAAYTMYGGDPTNLTPPQSNDFPSGYRLVAWITMQDFIIGSTAPLFYGFIAGSTTADSSYVLAIRGTSNGIEWWDDINAMLKQPFKVAGCGAVASAFARIYDTLEVLHPTTGVTAARPQAESMKSAGGFAHQVAASIRRHTAMGTRAAAPVSIEVAGHSLGAALATLYTLDNAKTEQISNPRLCTFASPLVGDAAFAAAFNALALTSWRIVNRPDIVTLLPPHVFGFCHVDTEQLLSSIGKVRSSVLCWHVLATYLSLLDPAQLPDPGCRLTGQA